MQSEADAAGTEGSLSSESDDNGPDDSQRYDALIY